MYVAKLCTYARPSPTCYPSLCKSTWHQWLACLFSPCTIHLAKYLPILIVSDEKTPAFHHHSLTSSKSEKAWEYRLVLVLFHMTVDARNWHLREKDFLHTSQRSPSSRLLCFAVSTKCAMVVKRVLTSTSVRKHFELAKVNMQGKRMSIPKKCLPWLCDGDKSHLEMQVAIIHMELIERFASQSK